MGGVHVSLVDRYRPGHSSIHRLDPRLKVATSLALLVSWTVLPDGAWAAFALALGMLMAIAWAAELGPAYALIRSAVALPFLAAATSVVFATPGRPLWLLHLGPWQLVATSEGVVRLASIVARGLLCVQTVVLLTATTPFHELVHALGHFRLPRSLVATLSFAYRYLFVLADEALRLKRARDARSGRPRSGGARPGARWQARVAGQMAGQLFVRSLDRSERVYQAMLARGYRGHLLTLRPHRMNARDWIAALLAVAAMVFLHAIARWSVLGR